MSRSSSSSSPSSSSSIDSSKNPPSPPSLHSSSCSSSTLASSSICRWSNLSGITAGRTRRDLSTDLRLGLSISSSSANQALVLNDIVSPQRDSQHWLNWQPVKPILPSALAGRSDEGSHQPASLYVKVYMEGVPIGRKLDLLCHDGYGDLSETLADMFKTPILCPNGNGHHPVSDKYCVLTYEDTEGDWMMVGDVPWEIFTSTVKRLKITRADRC